VARLTSSIYGTVLTIALLGLAVVILKLLIH
jgi:hypothetical protein